MNAKPTIALIAGEASGDLLGANLIAALRARLPGARFEGVAGPAMQAQGCTSIYPMERLSVMGLVEVAGRYLSLMRDRRELGNRWLQNPPDVFIGIDAPDFNLGLERRLRASGVPTVHYVSPSVWAWRRYRIRGIRAAVDLMLTLFPFEADFYADSGVNVAHVGHPLADMIDLEIDAPGLRDKLGLQCDGTYIALLPGSRITEIRSLGALMLETAAWLHAREPSLQFVMPAATEAIYTELRTRIDAQDLPISLINGQAREVMGASDVVVLASGTATLEALLLKKPMVITYKLHPLTYQIMKAMMHVDYVGLPNLLAGRGVVPERLQDEARAARIGADVLHWLMEPAARAQLTDVFNTIHHQLRLQASSRAADAIVTQLLK
jgi:lipid-A-disaccharide synthase